MPIRRINDPAKLRHLLDSVLLINADVELPDLLAHLLEGACSLVDARYGALGVLNETRTKLDQFLTFGLTSDEERVIGPRPAGRGVLGVLITDPAPLRLRNLRDHPDSYGFPANHPQMTSLLGLPVRGRGEVFGNLYLTDKRGADEFSDEDKAVAEALAVAAGIAIENRRLHDQVRVLSVLDDRERIAHDLHDRVIQRIFAVGMSLQGALRLEGSTEMVARVNRAIEELDNTITEIRTTIFDLGDRVSPQGIRRSLLDLADELAPTLGLQPEVRFDGPVDNAVSAQVADHVLAVVREALTNAGKYAQATVISISLTAADDLCLEVIDDGRGIEVPVVEGGGMGLTNLHHRAEKLGGTFEVGALDGRGTRLVWRVPC